MDVVVGALLVIIILIAIAALRRRVGRFDAQQNLDECQAEFDAAEHDLTLAGNLATQASQRGWADICRQLGKEGTNPALHGLVDTPDGDEPAAHDLFETAVMKLKQVHAKAQENLEMATSLLDDENEEV
jgi:hypothetical protein